MFGLDEKQKRLIELVAEKFAEWYGKGLEDSVEPETYKKLYGWQTADASIGEDMKIRLDFHKPAESVTVGEVREAVRCPRFQDAYRLACTDAYEQVNEEFGMDEVDAEVFHEENNREMLLVPVEDCSILEGGKEVDCELPWTYNLWGGGGWG